MGEAIKREIKMSSGEGMFEVAFGNDRMFRPTLNFTGAGFSEIQNRRFIAGFDKPDEARELAKALIEVADAYDALHPKKFRVTYEVESESEANAVSAVREGYGVMTEVKRV